MIRKILKWIGIVLGSLIGLLVLAFAILYIIGTVKWNKLHGKYEVPVETITIPTDQASMARGEHIATIRMVLEKPDCKDHFHLISEQIQAIHFGYCVVTTGGADPCIELINIDGEVCLRLFYYPYQVSELRPKYEQFMAQHQTYHQEVLTGEW